MPTAPIGETTKASLRIGLKTKAERCEEPSVGQVMAAAAETVTVAAFHKERAEELATEAPKEAKEDPSDLRPSCPVEQVEQIPTENGELCPDRWALAYQSYRGDPMLLTALCKDWPICTTRRPLENMRQSVGSETVEPFELRYDGAALTVVLCRLIYRCAGGSWALQGLWGAVCGWLLVAACGVGVWLWHRVALGCGVWLYVAVRGCM